MGDPGKPSDAEIEALVNMSREESEGLRALEQEILDDADETKDDDENVEAAAETKDGDVGAGFTRRRRLSGVAAAAGADATAVYRDFFLSDEDEEALHPDPASDSESGAEAVAGDGDDDSSSEPSSSSSSSSEEEPDAGAGGSNADESCFLSLTPIFKRADACLFQLSHCNGDLLAAITRGDPEEKAAALAACVSASRAYAAEYDLLRDIAKGLPLCSFFAAEYRQADGATPWLDEFLERFDPTVFKRVLADAQRLADRAASVGHGDQSATWLRESGAQVLRSWSSLGDMAAILKDIKPGVVRPRHWQQLEIGFANIAAHDRAVERFLCASLDALPLAAEASHISNDGSDAAEVEAKETLPPKACSSSPISFGAQVPGDPNYPMTPLGDLCLLLESRQGHNAYKKLFVQVVLTQAPNEAAQEVAAKRRREEQERARLKAICERGKDGVSAEEILPIRYQLSFLRYDDDVPGHDQHENSLWAKWLASAPDRTAHDTRFPLKILGDVSDEDYTWLLTHFQAEAAAEKEAGGARLWRNDAQSSSGHGICNPGLEFAAFVQNLLHPAQGYSVQFKEAGKGSVVRLGDPRPGRRQLSFKYYLSPRVQVYWSPGLSARLSALARMRFLLLVCNRRVQQVAAGQVLPHLDDVLRRLGSTPVLLRIIARCLVPARSSLTQCKLGTEIALPCDGCANEGSAANLNGHMAAARAAGCPELCVRIIRIHQTHGDNWCLDGAGRIRLAESSWTPAAVNTVDNTSNEEEARNRRDRQGGRATTCRVDELRAGDRVRALAHRRRRRRRTSYRHADDEYVWCNARVVATVSTGCNSAPMVRVLSSSSSSSLQQQQQQPFLSGVEEKNDGDDDDLVVKEKERRDRRGAWVTFEHPVLLGRQGDGGGLAGRWRLPKSIGPVVHRRPTNGRLYNLVLAPEPEDIHTDDGNGNGNGDGSRCGDEGKAAGVMTCCAVQVNGVHVITLGHGLRDVPCASHEYWGTSCCVDVLRERADWPDVRG